MRDYEIVYIFKSGFTPEEIEGKLGRYHDILTRPEGGEITAVEQWGKRQLAYPIRKEPNGYYVVAQFNTDPEALPELERVLTLDENLLRYLIVIAEGELPAPPSLSPVEEARGATPREEPTGEDKEKTDEEAVGEAAEAGDGEETASTPEGGVEAAVEDASPEGETEEGATEDAEPEGVTDVPEPPEEERD